MKYKFLPVIFSLILFACCNQNDETNKKDPYAVLATPEIMNSLDSISKKFDSSNQAFEIQRYQEENNPNYKSNKNVSKIGHLKITNFEITQIIQNNALGSISKADLLKLYKNKIIKPDLYILSSKMDYDESFDTKFMVKFINLTQNPITSIQISKIRLSTMYTYTEEYFSTHRFFISNCKLAPFETKIFSFVPDEEDWKRTKMVLEKGAKGTVVNIDYITVDGEHHSSEMNTYNNIKWKYKE